MKVSERIGKLRDLMDEKGIDIYIIPTADFHQTEYVGDHFKAREFITGFSGSAGTALVAKDEAYLWTDGRYFIQASKELKDSPVELMKMGSPGVPTIEDYLSDKLAGGGTLGFDGRVVSMGSGQKYEEIVNEKDGKIIYKYDLINEIWDDRPILAKEPAFLLDIKYSGEEVSSKLERIREKMKENNATTHVLTTLDDICWTLNIRGDDIEFFPLVLSYMIITMDKVDLYINEAKLSDEIKAKLKKDNVVLHAYNDIYEDIKKIDKEEVLLIDPSRLNYALYNDIPKENEKVEKTNPEIVFKAIKNSTEVENMRKAQIKDSIAHVKFMKWLKENIGKEKITEMSACDKLYEYRKEQGNYISPSFEPICSFGENAAIVHYTSTPETNIELEKGNFFLSDTGAGYYEGSTDITRAYALGEITPEMKDHFTLVAISNLNLGNVKFLSGVTGMNLDYAAKKPFWDRGLDYNHGTGHGLGYLLNIHEGPTGFRWQHRDHEVHPFEENMIITNEPGIYIEGSHGIRLENELLVRKGEENEYGQFMYFEAITYIPMDLDAINPDMMTNEDKKLLNDYHKLVFEKVSPHLNEEEKEWLKKYTREI
ncbi:MAG: aminopeptidase P family protein [Senegalia sp. (in: firmicutes)]|uniref:aminopeptidase P family protein n=1 Tax=Senegalia sp. (in: firmicutes) TaxID=1924098 RepID=UPI003F97B4DA